MVDDSTSHGGGELDSRRILVVEDERIVARDLANTLTDLGYQVVATTATGEDAIEKARALVPSLVLMDIHLKGSIDGIQAAETITDERQIPVIYLSAHADPETLERAKCTGPFGYLVKPFRAIELRTAIEVALHKHLADSRVRQRERWLETTLGSIGDAVVATDRQRRVRLMNPVAEALTGWKQAEAQGKAVDEIVQFVAEHDGAAVPSPIARALEHRRPATLGQEALLVTRTHDRIPVEESATPILTDDGELLGGVMVLRDLRERRQAQQEINQLHSEFEHRLAERTAQLEAANSELEAFSYSVAHDLRSPLSGIDGWSQLLAEEHGDVLGPDGLDLLNFVRRSTQRMSELIEDLLRLARVARADFHREQVTLSALARDVAEDLRLTRGERDVVIADDVSVDGNAHLLRIVLENLMGNAWKFTSQTTRPRVEFGSVEDNGQLVCFVRDNGAGFDMDHADKLFVPFERLHSQAEFNGTGIGLSIVRRIIDRHDGRIWAESSEGQGATFYFTV